MYQVHRLPKQVLEKPLLNPLLFYQLHQVLYQTLVGHFLLN